jgi:hypothetical protein
MKTWTHVNIGSLLLLISSATLAETCPANFEISAEKELEPNYQATLCWKQTSDTTGELHSILSSPALKKPITASFAVNTENQIKKIAFDDQVLIAKKGQLTLPVLIESRVHESEHDENITDLWLLQVNGNNLNKIFETQWQFASWATQCESDCRDTLQIDTVITLDSPQANGFNILKLHRTTTRIPYDQPESKGSSSKKIEEYRFNGNEYLAHQ